MAVARFAGIALFPRLSYRLRWPTRLNGPRLAAYIAMNTLISFSGSCASAGGLSSRITAGRRRSARTATGSVKLPGGGQIDPASLEAHQGPPAEIGDDSRPAIVRNIAPYGPGI